MVFLRRLSGKLAILAGALVSAGCYSAPTAGPSIVANPPVGAMSAPVRLADCPTSPNCVSSLSSEEDRRVLPFFPGKVTVSDYQQQLVAAMESDGGTIKDIRNGYVWATYTSSVFRFVDDIEWLYSDSGKRFDVRSVSRVGYSDLGVNRKRVERLRAMMASE